MNYCRNIFLPEKCGQYWKMLLDVGLIWTNVPSNNWEVIIKLFWTNIQRKIIEDPKPSPNNRLWHQMWNQDLHPHHSKIHNKRKKQQIHTKLQERTCSTLFELLLKHPIETPFVRTSRGYSPDVMKIFEPEDDDYPHIAFGTFRAGSVNTLVTYNVSFRIEGKPTASLL